MWRLQFEVLVAALRILHIAAIERGFQLCISRAQTMTSVLERSQMGQRVGVPEQHCRSSWRRHSMTTCRRLSLTGA